MWDESEPVNPFTLVDEELAAVSARMRQAVTSQVPAGATVTVSVCSHCIHMYTLVTSSSSSLDSHCSRRPVYDEQAFRLRCRVRVHRYVMSKQSGRRTRCVCAGSQVHYEQTVMEEDAVRVCGDTGTL